MYIFTLMINGGLGLTRKFCMGVITLYMRSETTGDKARGMGDIQYV